MAGGIGCVWMGVRLVVSWLIANLKCDTSGFVVVRFDAAPRLILRRCCPRAHDARPHGHGPRLWPVRSQTESCGVLPRSSRSYEEQGPQAPPESPPPRHRMVSSKERILLGRLVGWTPSRLSSWHGGLARGISPVFLVVWRST